MTRVADVPIYAGERVRAARTLLGVSQTSLAKSVGLTQSAISQIESGLLVATSQIIDQVAAVTTNPRSFFDAVPPDLPPVTLRFRKQARASITNTNRVTQLLAEAYRVVWTLVNERRGFIPPTLPIATDQHLNADGVEHYAQLTRTALGLDATGPVMHVTRALERGGAGDRAPRGTGPVLETHRVPVRQ